MSVMERLEEIRRLVRECYPDMMDDPECVPHDIDRAARAAQEELSRGDCDRPGLDWKAVRSMVRRIRYPREGDEPVDLPLGDVEDVRSARRDWLAEARLALRMATDRQLFEELARRACFSDSLCDSLFAAEFRRRMGWD